MASFTKFDTISCHAIPFARVTVTVVAMFIVHPSQSMKLSAAHAAHRILFDKGKRSNERKKAVTDKRRKTPVPPAR
jgi:hypothetical protein